VDKKEEGERKLIKRDKLKREYEFKNHIGISIKIHYLSFLSCYYLSPNVLSLCDVVHFATSRYFTGTLLSIYSYFAKLNGNVFFSVARSHTEYLEHCGI